MNTDAFDSLLASVDPPLIVVTAAVGAERAGCLVGFHAQSSIEPPRYSLWLSKANHTYRVASRSTHLAIHFLTSVDLAIAATFGTLTGDEVDKFAEIDWRDGFQGLPVLADCPHHLVMRRTSLLDEGGDHVAVMCEPITAQSNGRFEPLRLSQVSHLVPGHDSDERNHPPTERSRDHQ